MAKAQTEIRCVEAPLGSSLYAETLRLREAILRKPLGLTLSEAELADDRLRRHFCALDGDTVVGCVSLKPLGTETLQLKQMAVREDRRMAHIGAALVAHAEAWARAQGFATIVLHARSSAIGFYVKAGYAAQGKPFEENTIPHIRMVKPLS